MGLFNRKKELEKEIDRLMEENNELENKKYDLLERIGQLERQIESSNCLGLTLKENQILIDWVRKILETNGTMEVNSQHIKIPIIKTDYGMYNNSYFIKPTKTERIEIPAITIEKTEVIGDEKQWKKQ